MLQLLLIMTITTLSYHPTSVDSDPSHGKAKSTLIPGWHFQNACLLFTSTLPPAYKTFSGCTAVLTYATYVNVMKCAPMISLIIQPSIPPGASRLLLSLPLCALTKSKCLWSLEYITLRPFKFMSDQKCLFLGVIIPDHHIKLSSPNHHSHYPTFDLFSLQHLYVTHLLVYLSVSSTAKNTGQILCHAHHCITTTLKGPSLRVRVN